MEFASPQFATIGGRRLAYEVLSPESPGGTVLLLCGIGAKRQGRDVGDSDAATEQYTIRDLADDVYGLARELGMSSASLVGISMVLP